MHLQGMLLNDDGNQVLFRAYDFQQIYLKVIDNSYDQVGVNVNYDLGHGEDYQHDKASGKSITAKGDVVINTVSNLASVVHSRNAGKMLNQIFLRLNILDENTLDPWYLCYLLNKSEYIRYQEAAIMDGSVIRKLTKANLEDLEINLPGIADQKKMGEAYKEIMKKYTLAMEKAELERELYLQMLGEKDLNNREVV
ncbi:type I restriction endonuclease [Ligilactobacillus salivarius]|nr:type I restriction endonuclease [Ligilactobacillus salivarius]